MMRLLPNAAPALLAWLLLGVGCSWIPNSARQVPVLSSTEDSSLIGELRLSNAAPSERRCLLVMLPGIGDRAQQFEEHGFLSATHEHAPECDVVLVDAAISRYVDESVFERVGDVLVEAHRRGYRTVWLVGVSLGGYGAALSARRYAELVDGVLLIAPLLGTPPYEARVAQEIEEAGGLLDWPGLSDEAAERAYHFREPRLVWDWLRDAAREGRRSSGTSPLHLAYGTDDGFAERHRLLADALPEEAVHRAKGAHDWATWRSLYHVLLEVRPWKDASATPNAVRRRASSERERRREPI